MTEISKHLSLHTVTPIAPSIHSWIMMFSAFLCASCKCNFAAINQKARILLILWLCFAFFGDALHSTSSSLSSSSWNCSLWIALGQTEIHPPWISAKSVSNSEDLGINNVQSAAKGKWTRRWVSASVPPEWVEIFEQVEVSFSFRG